MNGFDDHARRAAAAVRRSLAEQPLHLPDHLSLARPGRRAASTLAVVLALTAGGVATWQNIDDSGQVAIGTGGKPGETPPSTSVAVSSVPPSDEPVSTTSSVPPSSVTTIPVAPGSRAQRWIGMVDPPGRDVPPGITPARSRSISFDPPYGMVFALDGDHEMLWFERRLPAGEHVPGTALIIDAVDVPPSSDGQRSFLAVSCAMGTSNSIKNPDPEIVARLGPPTGEQTANGTMITTGIELAWRFNRQTERIEPLPTTGIVCPDDRFGG